ncbi:MAG: YbaB/EbfC family nucleoid-associated protein [Bacteroidota bacterium]
MFGLNQKDMLEKMQKSLEESKERLSKIKVIGEAAGGLVKIELDGNRKLTSLEINADLKVIDKEDLEDFLALALEHALNQANAINESEVSNSARQFLPGF